MDLDKNPDDAGFHERLTRHSSSFLSSISFRGSAKRRSIIEPRDERPTCLESAHYPIFDTQSSRHSSRVRQISRRSERRTSFSDHSRQNDGTPILSRRTLHKAKSGFLALRAGLFRRIPRRDDDLFEIEANPLPKHGHAHQSTHGFSDISSSTQEDLNFGTDLYRIGRAQPRNRDDGEGNLIKQVPFFHPLNNTVSASQPRTTSSVLVQNPEPDFNPIVSTPVKQPFAYESYHDKIVMSETLNERKSIEANPSIVEDIPEDRADRLTFSVVSEDQHTPGSLSSNATDENYLGGSSLQSYDLDVASGQRREILGNWLDHEQSAFKKIEELRRLSETRNVPPFEMQQKRNHSSESMALPDYSSPSNAGTETPRRQGSLVTRSRTLATQEKVLIGDDSLETQANESPVSETRKCSATVKIAFPGLYHELLEQWVRENELSPTMNPGFSGLESQAILSPSYLPSRASTTLSHHNPDNQPPHPTELPWSCDTRLNVRFANILNNLQKENASISLTSLTSPRAVTVHRMQDSITLPCTMDDNTQQANTETTGPRERQSDERRRHSFGIHISERNESISRLSTDQVSRHESLRRSSQNEQGPVNGRPFFAPPGLWGGADSPCDSDFSTSYNRDNSALNSATYTSPTSISSAPWSPLDSPVDEEILFRAPHRDEYWIADGKNSSFYPDRGDLPVKGEYAANDGRVCFASGSGRDIPSRFRQPTRADVFNNMRRSFRRDAQANEEQDEGEPDEDAPSSSQAQM
ncbi:hypothetical protein F1880_003252 [Penicillium rolfsii]|nr:hypothetical protein F1880_003252 [Penicillium rolfsii]